MNQINIQKISFYCIKISFHGKQLFLFRRFTKMSRLRKGLLSQLVQNELIELDKNFLGIDEMTDMVLKDAGLLIINHISLERIFNYRDEFQEMTNQAIKRITDEGMMANIEHFSEDCLNDVRIMKRFTNLMSKERLPLFFDNYDRVPGIVNNLGLDIEFDEEGKIIYRDKSQLFHIIHLMSDSYFKSLIAARIGVAEMEGNVTASTNTNGIHRFNSIVAYKLVHSYTLSNSLSQALTQLYSESGSYWGANSYVVSGTSSITF